MARTQAAYSPSKISGAVSGYAEKVAESELALHILLVMPLLFVLGHPATTRALRVLLLFGLFLYTLFNARALRTIKENISNLSQLQRALLIVCAASIVGSALLHTRTFDAATLGSAPQYLGLCTWLLFLYFGLLFSSSAQLLFKKTPLVLISLVVFVSATMSLPDIVLGYRARGLLLLSTSMATYALLLLVLALYAYTKGSSKCWSLGGAFLAMSTIALTKSRIGYTYLVLVILCWAYYVLRRKSGQQFLLVVALLVFGGLFALSSIVRFNPHVIYNGVAYRLEIYRYSLEDLNISKPLGNGVETNPERLNSSNNLAPSITHTLQDGYNFTSSHNLFLDVSRYFGIAFGVAALGY